MAIPLDVLAGAPALLLFRLSAPPVEPVGGAGATDYRLEVGKRIEDQATTVDALKARVAQLEERLDFTERLLAGRSTTAAGD